MNFRVLLSLCLICSGPLLGEEGNLPRFEDQAKPTAATKPARLPVDDNARCEAEREKNYPGRAIPEGLCKTPGERIADTFVGPILLGILAAPFYLPAWAVGDTYGESRRFMRYPYEQGVGYFAEAGSFWLVEAGTLYQWQHHGPHAWGGALSLMTAWRWGLDINYTRYHEKVADEKNTLAFFDVVPTFSFARTEKWDWRAGVGYEAVQGRDHSDRVKLVYKIRRFWELPVHVDADFGVSLAAGKPVFDLAPGIAYHRDRFQVKVAYRRRSVSDVVLHGPEVAIQIWF